MMQRWSIQRAEPLRSFLRRGVLLLLAAVIAVIVSITPFMSRPAAAAPLDLGLGGNSCSIETVGWVICPTMRSIARLADKGFTYINQSSLGINYSLFSNNGKTFTAWQVMRNIANGLFVIVFLIIIYSYLVGRTGGQYNIKRLLPRLLIAVIAVNISYYLGVIIIDLSNIIGDAIWNFLKTIYGNGSPVMPLGASANPLNDGNLTKMTAAAMGNTALVWVLLPPIAAVTISVALISAVAVILIIMREALVAALILAAPVLIVLYLLPNMERFAAQAMRLFLQLLLLYPIIALLLGTGQIVSMAAGGWDGPTAPYGGGTMSIVPDLVAAAAAVVPLLGVWFIFKNMSAVMSTAGSRLSASIAGRRGNKDDKNARVTGKASAGGAAGVKGTAGIGGMPNRRQAFSRNKHRRSLSGSALTGEDNQANDGLRAGTANRPPAANSDALQNALNANANADQEKRAEELQNASLNGDADNLNVENAAAAALESEASEKEKPKTAKDIFNNLNHAHESKDKDRKLSGAQAPAGGEAAAPGSAAPSAPTTSYRAPSIAQGGNIVTGGAPQQPAQIIAIPVQVDASSLLGQQNAARPQESIIQPPTSGIEEKAKARAQKYLFDADKEIAKASDETEKIFGKTDTPTEPPHTSASHDKDQDDR